MLFLYFHFFQLFNYWLVSTLVIFHIHTAHSYADDFYNIRYLNKQNFLQEMEKKKIIKNGAEWVREQSKRRREKKNPRNLHKIWSKFREQPEEWWWWWGGERKKKKMRMEKCSNNYWWEWWAGFVVVLFDCLFFAYNDLSGITFKNYVSNSFQWELWGVVYDMEFALSPCGFEHYRRKLILPAKFQCLMKAQQSHIKYKIYESR